MICKFFLNELELKLNRRKAVRVKGGVSVGLRSVCAKLNFDAVAPKSPTHLHTRSQITIAPKYKKQKPTAILIQKQHLPAALMQHGQK